MARATVGSETGKELLQAILPYVEDSGFGTKAEAKALAKRASAYARAHAEDDASRLLVRAVRYLDSEYGSEKGAEKVAAEVRFFLGLKPRTGSSARVKKSAQNAGPAVEQYEHKDKKRANNPPVGLVTSDTDKDEGKKTYAYDPHLDPQLQWTGKAERTSFDVPTVSLHVHERVDSRTILEAVKRKETGPIQASLFAMPEENPPLREALDFYKHPHGWSNRVITGDSLLVMNSLVEKEGLAGHVQMIYIDPPYGVRYGSNFQPFTNQRDVRDGRETDLTREPETIRAFRDTWELGIHSYLTYLRDRLLLSRELLAVSGSVFVQISDENLHHVRELLDEVFGASNFCSVITFAKTSGYGETSRLASVSDYLLWYAKDREQLKYRQLYYTKDIGSELAREYRYLEAPDGTRRPMSPEELAHPERIPEGHRAFRPDNITSQGATQSGSFAFEFEGEMFTLGPNLHWKTSRSGMDELARRGRIMKRAKSLSYVRYLDDFPVAAINNNWLDTRWGFDAGEKMYVVQTHEKVAARCVLMTTDPGDLVLDPTCGSGTTAVVCERYGRRWITCDTSRVAVTLAKQRVMTALFDYYELAHPTEGVGSGFRYRTVPHVTLGSIANREPTAEEHLYDQPLVDTSRVRVSGPFTVEAVPAPVVRPVEEPEVAADDASIARSGPTARQAEWRAHLSRAGIRGRAGQRLEFSRVEPQGGTRYLHAMAETKEQKPQLVAISFGPEHAPLEQRQVELAWEEARGLSPRPAILVFAAFQFDPEAAKDIDELDPAKAGMTFLRVQMDPDLLVDDLRKKRASDHSFWLIGQPDVQLKKDGEKYRIEVAGFDYYDTRTGAIESGDTSKIAMWLLDTDYDGRSLFPRQVFFPMGADKDGWTRLAKDLKAVVDEELIEAYRGTVSLPFDPGPHRRAAVKIVDDRGIESLKLVELE